MAESQRLELWKPLLASAVFKTAALPVMLTLHILGCATVTLKFIVHMRYTRNISYLPIMRLTPEFLCLMYGVEPLYPCVAEGIGLEPTRRLLDYWQISNLLPYQLGLTLRMFSAMRYRKTCKSVRKPLFCIIFHIRYSTRWHTPKYVVSFHTPYPTQSWMYS